MKATTENLIALGIGYRFDGKKTVFNLEELLKVFQGASYQESDVQEIDTEDGLTSVEYIDAKNVDFENAKFVQPEVVEEEETPLETEEVVEDKSDDKKIIEDTTVLNAEATEAVLEKKEEVKEIAKAEKPKTTKKK